MRAIRNLLLVALTVVSTGLLDSAAPSNSSNALESQASIGPLEVRIRRLHRVRPDLRQFPIQFDTIC